MIFGDLGVVDADHGRDVVPHRIHGVVALVAVDGPVASDSVELERAHLAHGDVGRDLGPTGALGTQPPSVPVTLEVGPCRWIGWLVIVRLPTRMRTRSPVRATKGSMPGRPAVPRPKVEVEHRVHAWRGAARLDVIGVQDEAVVAIDAVLLRVLGVDDEQAHHPHGHLRHLVGMRVVHVRARALQHELVHEGLATAMGG